MIHEKSQAPRTARAMGGVREELVAEVAIDTISNLAAPAVRREAEEDWGR
jgi:hypothetical protein